MSKNKFLSWEDAVEWLISQPDQQDLVRSCYYDRPAEKAAERFWRSDEWGAVRSYLPTHGGMALDVGAGNGIASYALARDGWRVVALEPDGSQTVGADAIRRLAKMCSLDIKVVQGFGEGIASDNALFDVIHARQVLHHARDLSQFCQELFRVLKSDGVFVATRDHVISGPKQLPAFLKGHPLHRFYGGENAYRLSEYKAALSDAGFIIERVIGPFDSVINYAPYTRSSLREVLVERAAKVPVGSVIAKVMFADPWFDSILKLLSRIDRRPGRQYSFICRKPGKTH